MRRVRSTATDVTGYVLPGSGHWIMESPDATVAAVRAFVDGKL